MIALLDILANTNNASLIVIFLFVAAVMFLLEICTPSFGMLAAAGVAAIGASVYFAFQINYIVGLLVLLGCILALPVYLYFAVKLLPRTPFGKRLFLKRAADATNQATPEADSLAKLVGKAGQAETTLRPAGMVRIEGQRVAARAERGMIEKDKNIVVVKAEGTEVIVRLADTK